MTASKCKSCGAPIYLVKLRKLDGTDGKWMPVDAERTNSVAPGKVAYNPSTDRGRVIRSDEVADAHVWVFERGAHCYRSHFASCPVRRPGREAA